MTCSTADGGRLHPFRVHHLVSVEVDMAHDLFMDGMEALGRRGIAVLMVERRGPAGGNPLVRLVGRADAVRRYLDAEYCADDPDEVDELYWPHAKFAFNSGTLDDLTDEDRRAITIALDSVWQCIAADVNGDEFEADEVRGMIMDLVLHSGLEGYCSWQRTRFYELTEEARRAAIFEQFHDGQVYCTR
jgi:hypothetical protein